jgi:hypothetical protein
MKNQMLEYPVVIEVFNVCFPRFPISHDLMPEVGEGGSCTVNISCTEHPYLSTRISYSAGEDEEMVKNFF